MKIINKQYLKLISSLAMCLLSMFSLVMLTFSWFAINNNASGNGMDINMEKNECLIGAEYFYVGKNGDGKSYIPFAEDERKSLGAYDLLEENYHVLIKVYVVENMTEVYLTASTQTTYYLGNTNANGTPLYPLLKPSTSDVTVPEQNDTYTNALSSVVTFTVLDSTTELEKTATGYNYLGSGFPDVSRRSRFISDAYSSNAAPEGEVYVKQADGSTIISTVPDTDSKGTSCRSFVIFISYDPDLISTVFSVNIGNDNIYTYDEQKNHVNIPFKCDFTLSVKEIQQ